MFKPRFSLRSLLGLAVLLALAGYWRDRPRQNANRFVALIETGDYSAAEAMFGERVGLSNPPTIFWKWKAHRGEQSAGDWLRGRYPLVVTSTLGRDVYALAVEATATGMARSEQWKLLSLPPEL